MEVISIFLNHRKFVARNAFVPTREFRSRSVNYNSHANRTDRWAKRFTNRIRNWAINRDSTEDEAQHGRMYNDRSVYTRESTRGSVFSDFELDNRGWMRDRGISNASNSSRRAGRAGFSGGGRTDVTPPGWREG